MFVELAKDGTREGKRETWREGGREEGQNWIPKARGLNKMILKAVDIQGFPINLVKSKTYVFHTFPNNTFIY